MSNSKNYNKNFGTILTNEADKVVEKGGSYLEENTKFVDYDVHKQNPYEDKENNSQNVKGKPEQIISTGYDNDFIKNFGGEINNNVKNGIGNVDGIYDDSKLFKDDFKNYGKFKVDNTENNTEKTFEKHDYEDKPKHEEDKGHYENGYEKEKCHWTCEDVLCEPEFECGCDPISEALGDIVESIAHQENGIAKILEAESKKICRAISMAECVEDLVKVNKSVQDTIKQINNVQIVLNSKLQEVSDICDGCCDDHSGR